MNWRRFLALALIATGLLRPCVCADPVGAALSADAAKAAYLVNFVRFTEWPASLSDPDNTPFVIGVAGNRELEDYLWKIVDGKLLQGRKVRILRLVAPSDVEGCRLIYINPTPSRSDAVPVSTEEWLHAARGKPVLTVSHEDGFLQKGGVVNFYSEGQNLRFEISPNAASAAGLRLSSRLLALARIVHTSPPDPYP